MCIRDSRRHHHRHHHHRRKHSRKHKQIQSVDSDSEIEITKVKKPKHDDDFTAIKIKQEPVSDADYYSLRRTKNRNDPNTR